MSTTTNKTDEENGAALAGVIQGLEPGDMLKIGPGRYSIARKFEVDLQGTAQAPDLDRRSRFGSLADHHETGLKAKRDERG